MLKVNIKDFRIGNIVLYNGLALPISQIYDDNTISVKDHRSINNNISLNDIFPIAINSNWLSLLGFKIYEDVIENEHEYYERYVLEGAINKDKDFEIHIIYSTYGDTLNISCCYSIGKLDRLYHIINPRYIHTLQNYFLLTTGKELKIK